MNLDRRQFLRGLGALLLAPLFPRWLRERTAPKLPWYNPDGKCEPLWAAWQAHDGWKFYVSRAVLFNTTLTAEQITKVAEAIVSLNDQEWADYVMRLRQDEP